MWVTTNPQVIAAANIEHLRNKVESAQADVDNAKEVLSKVEAVPSRPRTKTCGQQNWRCVNDRVLARLCVRGLRCAFRMLWQTFKSCAAMKRRPSRGQTGEKNARYQAKPEPGDTVRVIGSRGHCHHPLDLDRRAWSPCWTDRSTGFRSWNSDELRW